MGESVIEKPNHESSVKILIELTPPKKRVQTSPVLEKPVEATTIQLQPNSDSPICTFCMSGINCRTVRQRTKLMNIFLESLKPEEALLVFERLVKEGHLPSRVTYNTLLYTLTALKRFDQTHSIISTFKERGLQQDSYFFNAVINAFCRAGDMNEAMNTLSEMKKSGVTPTVNTLNILIRGYGVAGKPKESLKVMELLVKEDGVKPNLRSYFMLVKAWCKKGDITGAWKMVDMMVASGLRPNGATYSTIATAYVHNGQTAEAESLISKMQRDNIQPDERTCGTIIAGYYKEGKIRDGLRFVYKMKDLGVQPNVVVFNSLIKGFLDVSDRDRIDEVLSLMEDFGVGPDVVTFSTIMNAWGGAGYIEKCREVFDDMVRCGIKPDIYAYNILAKGYVRSMEPEKAEAVLAESVNSGIQQNPVIFTTIISGWCTAGRMDSAMKVFDQMCNYGIAPTLRTFEAIILGYYVAKDPWKAEEMVEIMKRFNVQPERSTFLLVEKAWRAHGLSKAGGDRNRVVVREADFPSKSLKSVATTSMHVACGFRKRAPFVCQRQFGGKHCLSGLVGHSSTVVFLN